jgi:hypothetical protein
VREPVYTSILVGFDHSRQAENAPRFTVELATK